MGSVRVENELGRHSTHAERLEPVLGLPDRQRMSAMPW